jgi:ubiquinone/menaquinone biosynthesis C-methylase UbiE
VWKGPPASTLDLPAGEAVLELGCGNGKTLAALARREGTVVGLDLARNALRACPAGPALVQGDALALPFVDGSFGAVVMSHLLGHLTAAERAEAAKEVQRVLRPGGVLLVRAFSVRDMRFGKGEEVEPATFRRGNGILHHYFTAEELRALFRDLEEVSLREEVAVKRYGGERVERAELVGTFRR